MTQESKTRKKVIIIGGGFAGLNTAQGLFKADLDILLLDKTNHHVFQPLLYQVATSALSADNIACPIRQILAKQKNVAVFLADIVAIDKKKKEVVSENGDRYAFDYLIVAPGARHAYFGHPEWEAMAPGLKTVSDALSIRERILLSYERAERCQSEQEALRFLRFVVVGAGPTGVEMAGAIAEIANKSLIKDFRYIKTDQTKIYLIEGAGQVLPSFPESLGKRAQKDLEKMGVEVFLNTYVTNITPDGVWLKETFLESPNVIWAAGNAASPLLKTLDTEIDNCGRVLVGPDLTIPNCPDIFVIGDAARCLDKKGAPLPGIAPVAIQQGRYVARLLTDNVESSKRKPFSYFDKGMMATIGKAKAVAMVGKLKISGYLAWLAWGFIHIVYLVSFTDKIHVLLQWFYLYVLNKRRIRLIVRPVTDHDDPMHKKG